MDKGFISVLRNKESCKCLICLLIMVLSMYALSGCAEKVVTAQPDSERQAHVWESEEGTTIRWVKEISNSRDAGLRETFLQRMRNVLFGRKSQFIARPYAVYADGTGLLCLSDPGSGVFHLYDIKKGGYRIIDKFQGGQLSSPVGIAGDSNGTLFLTDSVLGRIYRYDSQKGKLETFTQVVLGRPTGIAFNADNWLLYVSDTIAHQIVVFGLDGVERFRFGQRGSGPGEFNYPTDLWIDGEGRLLVTDSMNARIQIFGPGGEFLTALGVRGHAAGYLDKPKGVATDSSGRIYICDALKDTVQVFSPDGFFLLRFGTRGQGDGQFWMPAGLFIDKNDRIYVADSYNQRIQVFEVVRANE